MGTPMKSTVLDALKAASATIEAATKSAADAIKPTLQQFLVEHPRIRAIRWTQYSPHFNDGEPCTFSVNDIEVLYKESVDADLKDGDVDESDAWFDPAWPSDEEQKLMGDDEGDLEELNLVLQDSEAALEQLFGDGYQITVTPAGASVDEYEHD